jgi:hypothetical protein
MDGHTGAPLRVWLNLNATVCSGGGGGGGGVIVLLWLRQHPTSIRYGYKVFEQLIYTMDGH